MAIEDFCRYFTKTTMCHLMNTSIFSFSKRWHLFKHNNEWKPGSTAGGCVVNQDTFFKNPQVLKVARLNGWNFWTNVSWFKRLLVWSLAFFLSPYVPDRLSSYTLAFLPTLLTSCLLAFQPQATCPSSSFPIPFGHLSVLPAFHSASLSFCHSVFLPNSPSPFLPVLWSLSRQPAVLFQYAFSIKDEDEGEVMIALMQEDTRIDRDEGGTNLSIGYFIMKVTCANKLALSVFSAWYFLP